MTKRPIEPVLAVGAVVTVEHSLLMVRRGRPPGIGLWTVPGGRVEANESVERAVEREVLEETGLTVLCGRLIGWVQRRGQDFNYVILDFEASLSRSPNAADNNNSQPALRAGDDAAEALWVRFSELHKLMLVPGLMEFLTEHEVMPTGPD